MHCLPCFCVGMGGSGLPESVLRNFDLLEVAKARLTGLLAHDPQLQAAVNHGGEEEELLDDAKCPTSIETLHRLCQLYQDRPALGSCPPWEPPSSYTTLTYRQLWARVQALATGLHARGLPGGRGQGRGRGDFMGILGFGSVNWCLAEFAGLYLGLVVVPLPLNVTSSDLAYMMSRGGMSLLFLSLEEAHTESVIKAIDASPGISTVILMDSFGREADLREVRSLPHILAWQAQRGMTVLSMEEVVGTGEQQAQAVPMVVPGKGGEGEADPLISLMYTSGSTGLPKGACLHDSLERQYWLMGARQLQMMGIPQILIGYMPLNHAGGRLTVRQALISGGTLYFVRKSDISSLLEDTAFVRPTSLLLVPRISSMIHETYLCMVDKCPPGVDPQEHQEESRRRLRDEVMGGRLIMAVAGTAPTSPEVLQLIRDACQLPVLDGYGSTECGGITIDCRISDNITEYRLDDVPELGYTTLDQPYPRGELLVKSRTGIRCYYQDEAATTQLIDEEGFYHTGDIMEQRGADAFVWVDRRKNVIKLAQGEYVSVSRLEAYLSGSSAIHQIYLYGNSLRSYLLAVVVPNSPHKDKMTEEDKARDRALIRAELDRMGKEGGLQGFEVPRSFIVDYEPFSRANSLLTDSNKPARARLRKHYGERLEELYRAMEDRKEKKRQQLMTNPMDSNLEERFKAALEVTLGLDTHEIDMERSFLHSGGDSLYAVRFAHHLQELCQAKVPVAAILNPAATLGTLLDVVKEAAAPKSGMVSVASVHGCNTAVIRAQDILLERFIPPQDLQQAAATAPPSSHHAPKVILITGANGYLGRFLVRELLVHAGQVGPGAQVVALVRARDDEVARERLLSSYGRKEDELRQVVEGHAASYLTVYAGDLGRPLLGLSKEVYERLCQDVDLVLHNGALVNHTFTYDQLFLPNVVGTSQLLHMAIKHKKKAFHFISTVGVAFGYGTSEDAYGTRLGAERRTDGGYAAGYGASKWVGEVLLERAAAELGVAVTLYRCGMILPHSGSYLGQINVPDMFTRLVCGLVYSKTAPPSFYDPTSTCRPVFDGLPVDFVAKSIVGLAIESRRNGRPCVLYHVLEANHATGANLDDVLRWIQSAGYPVVRMEDYGAWAQEFRNRCQGMKQASPIPLMHQWDRPLKADPALNLTADHYHAALKEVLGITSLPAIDEAYVHHCLRHMVALGLIKRP